MREKDYYGAIKGFCLKWNLPEVWNSDRITGANLIYEVIKVINAMIIELRDYEERVDGKLETMLKMIEDFLKMFNEDLSETVLNILVEWKESGELEEIINDALFNQKLDRSVFESFKETYDQTIINLNENIEKRVMKESLEKFYIDATNNKYVNIENRVQSNISQSEKLNLLISLIPENSTLYFPKGAYLLEEKVVISKPIRILGTSFHDPISHELNPEYTMFVCSFKTDTLTMFEVLKDTDYVVFEKINIANNDWTSLGGRGTAISMGDYNSEGVFCKFNNFFDVYITNFNIAFNIENSYKIKFERCVASASKSYGFRVNGRTSTTVSFDDCWAMGGSGTGYFISWVSYLYLNGCAVDYMNRNGYVFQNCKAVTLNSCGGERVGENLFRFIDSYATLNSCYGYMTGRKIGVDNVPLGTASFMFYQNSDIITNNCMEYSQELDVPYSITANGNNAVTHNLLKIIKQIISDQRVSIDGVYSVNSIPTVAGGNQIKIVYNNLYNGDNPKGWMWAPSQAKWLPI